MQEVTQLAGCRAQNETQAMDSCPLLCAPHPPALGPPTPLTGHLQPHLEPPSLLQGLPAGVVALVLQAQRLDAQGAGVHQGEAGLGWRAAGIGGQEEDGLRVIPVPGHRAAGCRDVAAGQSRVLMNLSDGDSLQTCTREGLAITTFLGV
uniref:Uncharacterized protein n=1 Tax=Pipistrellus kuhlii TaxID=59472 RepID=A0A7J7XW25_PIPKU|nr:hypothetical protein mPipKuh1_010487 [Pipistrellus kuhlii]